MDISGRPSKKDIRKFKQSTSKRLHKYRDKYGLGSFLRLSELTGLTVFTLYDMLNCMPQNIELWQKLSHALDSIETGTKT